MTGSVQNHKLHVSSVSALSALAGCLTHAHLTFQKNRVNLLAAVSCGRGRGARLACLMPLGCYPAGQGPLGFRSQRGHELRPSCLWSSPRSQSPVESLRLLREVSPARRAQRRRWRWWRVRRMAQLVRVARLQRRGCRQGKGERVLAGCYVRGARGLWAVATHVDRAALSDASVSQEANREASRGMNLSPQIPDARLRRRAHRHQLLARNQSSCSRPTRAKPAHSTLADWRQGIPCWLSSSRR